MRLNKNEHFYDTTNEINKERARFESKLNKVEIRA